MQENSAEKQAVHVLLSILLSIISCVSMIPMFCSCIVFTETVCCNIQTTNSTNFRSQSVTFTAKLLLRRRLRLHNHLPILEPQKRPSNPRTPVVWKTTPPLPLGFPTDVALENKRCMSSMSKMLMPYLQRSGWGDWWWLGSHSTTRFARVTALLGQTA